MTVWINSELSFFFFFLIEKSHCLLQEVNSVCVWGGSATGVTLALTLMTGMLSHLLCSMLSHPLCSWQIDCECLKSLSHCMNNHFLFSCLCHVRHTNNLWDNFNCHFFLFFVCCHKCQIENPFDSICIDVEHSSRMMFYQTEKSSWFVANCWSCFWGQCSRNKWKTISFCWSSQCFQLDFVCWAGSFVIDWLISDGGGLLCMPMETWSVSAGTTCFVVGSGLSKNCNSLFGTQGAVFGGETFDCTDWVALSHNAAGCSSTLVDWGSTCVTQLGWKCLVHESNFSPSLTSFLALLKCCCILALNVCFVSHMCAFPVLLHLTLQAIIEFLHMVLCCGQRHHFLQFCSFRLRVQFFGKLGRQRVSHVDLLEKFPQGCCICGETQTLSTIGG